MSERKIGPLEDSARQWLHEERQEADPEHDQSSCWCCCWDCNEDEDEVLERLRGNRSWVR